MAYFKTRTALLLWSALSAAPVAAQPDQPAPPAPGWTVLSEIGGWHEDSARLEQLLQGAPTSGYLIRTPSAAAASGLAAVLPQSRLVWNSHIPYSLNEGAMFAGRGANFRVRAGARLDAGWLTVALVPELVAEENREFQTIPYGADPSRHPNASPWHWVLQSADLPLRFGSGSRTLVGWGESVVAVQPGPVRVGVSTESQWWGPGLRNALVMSHNAGGVPHVFAATARPWRTPAGEFEARWILGRMEGSAYFDTAGAQPRALAGIVATLQPAFEPGLTLGVARTVYGPTGGPERLLDVFRGVGHPNVTPARATPPAPLVGRDQILSIFGRWVLAEVGLEVYGEWARTDLPTSPRDLILDPQRSLGYTMGLQWANTLRSGGVLRLQTEATVLEQSDRLGRRVASFYTSRAVAEGYTHRGQVVGAAIGPGGSSQWLAADYLLPGRRVGAFVGRIRWENDALYTRGIQPSFHAHDVTVLAGARAGARIGPLQVGGEAFVNRRANYLFQNQASSFWNLQAMDLRNLTFALDVGLARPPRLDIPAPPAPPPPLTARDPDASDAPAEEAPRLP